MKKFIPILLAIAMLAALTSCNSEKIVSPQNAVSPANLTADQQEIIELLSVPNTQEIMLFDFNTEEAYSRLDIWVEFYENGELIGQRGSLGTYLDSPETLDGRMMIMINKNQWTLSETAVGQITMLRLMMILAQGLPVLSEL